MTDKGTNELHAALFELESELDSLKAAKQQIEEVTSVGKKISKSVAEIEKKYHTQIDNLIAEVDKQIGSSVKKLNKSIVSYDETHKQHAEIINEHLDTYEKLAKKVDDLIKKINAINFPDRLDKLDVTISSINTGLHNNQTKLENINRDVHDFKKEILSDIQAKHNDQFTEVKLIKNWTFFIVATAVAVMVLEVLQAFNVI